MATQPFEGRLSALDHALLVLAQSQARTQAQIERTDAQIERTQAQLSAEMRAFKTEMLAFKDEMREFKDEMRAFKDEMREFKIETRAMGARADRKWGELANRMGTLTEDIVLPGIATVFRSIFGDEGRVDQAIRVWRTHPADPGRSEEYDALVSHGDVLVVAECKSTLRPEHLAEFREKLVRSREFLPEAAGKRVFGLLASFLLDPSLVTAGERQGLIMVSLGTGLLQMLNTPGFEPRAF